VVDSAKSNIAEQKNFARIHFAGDIRVIELVAALAPKVTGADKMQYRSGSAALPNAPSATAASGMSSYLGIQRNTQF